MIKAEERVFQKVESKVCMTVEKLDDLTVASLVALKDSTLAGLLVGYWGELLAE